MTNKVEDEDKQNKELEKKTKGNKKKELLRKNNALVEIVALIMLKKKLDCSYHKSV